jgi:hypothetical protein
MNRYKNDIIHVVSFISYKLEQTIYSIKKPNLKVITVITTLTPPKKRL